MMDWYFFNIKTIMYSKKYLQGKEHIMFKERLLQSVEVSSETNCTFPILHVTIG